MNGDKETVEYICYERDSAGKTQAAVRAFLKQNGDTQSVVGGSAARNIVDTVVERCRSVRASKLVTVRFAIESLDVTGIRTQTSEDLIRSAPCATYMALFGQTPLKDIRKILLIANSGPHDMAALRFADQLRRKSNATLTIATIEDESNAKAEHAGERAIQSLLHDADLDEEPFETKVVVDRIRHRGIRKCYEGHDLIISGSESTRDIWPLRQSLNETTAIIIKRNPPLRLRSIVEWFPHVNPRDHAELLQDLRQGSRWNSDFVGMLALASAIATLGLMQNSTAVVIGSMLLAPLMTPMIGTGLALAQANLKLAKACATSIAYGTLLTFAISLLLGIITPARETLPPEVLSRGAPNIWDLLIAFFSAMAATFAMARPNLSGAVAGVAIATALVPPVCAAGLSLSHGSYGNSLGAMLLFGTNLIAIIVASRFTFALLGIAPYRTLPRHRFLAWWGRWGLVGLMVIISGPLSFMLLGQFDEGRSQTAIYPVTRAVSRALHERVAQDSGVEITLLGRPSVHEGVLIHIASNQDLPPSYADELRAIVRVEMNDPEVPVIVIALQGLWLSDSDEGLQGRQ
ncbi:DUF389 domain-containing protein [Symmachiella macrocystis]|uniref:DUF389 domain-containing protein n=1 Tax=Symmachiella macrocystis TaxID=2527985 RepID=UPI0018D31CCD|nr:DUF389 domain-containing protein [Symmachiella macrocystis]